MNEILHKLPTPPLGLHWCKLNASHLGSVEALHRASIVGMSPQAVKPESTDFFASILAGRGLIIGLGYKNELIAYGVLQHDIKSSENPLSILKLPLHTPVWKLAGASVAQHWRHQKLQRRLIEARLRLTADTGAFFSTASPTNPASWSNLLACGFTIHSIAYLYGGHPRYLMVKIAPALDNRILQTTHTGIIVGCGDVQQQVSLIEKGWRGTGANTARSGVIYQPTLPR